MADRNGGPDRKTTHARPGQRQHMTSAAAVAQRVHAKFCELPGAEHISTAYALEQLLRHVDRVQPQRVLELGAGIGTMTYALTELLAPDAQLTTLEDHPFCLEQLQSNLRGREERFELVQDLTALAGDFDFLIVDGADPADPRPFQHLAPGATVFIEGDRRPQMHLLEQTTGIRPRIACELRGLRRRTNSEGLQVWDGGGRLVRFEPRPADRLLFLAWKLRSSVNQRLRKVLG